MSYEISALSIVGTIRQSLQGVTGFSLVNELLQNADDSGARKWALGWHPGLDGASHPLLQGPAVFVTNDGPFRPRDAKALRQLHISGKGDDSGSIGKFGLGLKSIFHLGEAFFIVGPGTNGEQFEFAYPDRGLISPWVLQGDHADTVPEWGAFPAPAIESLPPDDDRIRDAVDESCGWFGFTIWVPLRLRRHTQRPNGKQAYIHSHCYDDQRYPHDLFHHNLESRLAQVWPMLRSLQAMQVVGPTDATQFRLSLMDESVRRRYPLSTTAPKAAIPERATPFRGAVAGQERTWSFYGSESGVHDLFELRAHSHWPKTTNVTERESYQVPDKSLPHAAAVFSVSDQVQHHPRLRIGWSVFLPMPQHHGETLALDGKVEVRLDLHGYFFLSTDRTRILEWGEPPAGDLRSESDVQQVWNHRLAREGVLPAILDAFAEFANDARRADRRLEDHERLVTVTTKALSEAKLYSKHQADICADRAWLFRLFPEGVGRWDLVAGSAEILTCPSLRELTRLFPATSDRCRDSVITDDRHPVLSARSPLRVWPTNLVARLLASPNWDFVQTEEGLTALARFLHAQAESGSLERLADPLVGFLRRLIAPFGENISEHAATISAILELLPESNRLEIPAATPLHVVRSVQEAELEHVVTYPAAIGLRATPTLEFRDAHRLLQLCAGHLGTQELILAVLAATPSGDRLREAVRTQPLFQVTRHKRPELVSLDDLRTAETDRRLFEVATNQYTRVQLLQDCMVDVSLMQIDPSLAAVLQVRPARGDRLSLQRFLTSCPKLVVDPAPRLELLAFLVLEGGSTDEDRRVLRYLLHANPQAFESDDPLFHKGERSQEAAEILAKTLRHRGEDWRWLSDAESLSRFSVAALRRLRIVPADLEALEQFLANDTASEAFPDYCADECDYLLERLRDPDLRRALPIHETIDGTRVALDDSCYLESEFLRDYRGRQDLFKNVKQIRRHPELAFEQQRLGLNPLDATTVVSQAIVQEDPSEYWRDLMAVLPNVSSQSTGRQLRKYAWLPLANGAPVRPEQVVHLPTVADIVEHVLHDTGAPLVTLEHLEPEVRDHPHLHVLIEKVLPSEHEALDAFGEVLATLAAYRVGELHLVADDAVGGAVTVHEWKEAIGADASALPSAGLLARLGAAHEVLWPHLLAEIDLPRIHQHLALLRDRHDAESNAIRRSTILRVHNAYLRLACASPEWSLDAPSVRLLSQAGSWHRPSELAYAQENVAKSHLVAGAQAKIIEADRQHERAILSNEAAPVLPDSPSAWKGIDTELAQTARIVRDYFEPWEGHVKTEVIGGFLALLGAHSAMETAAEHFLGNFSLDNVRASLDAEPREWLRGQPNTLREKIEHHRFLVRVESAASFEVENLTGGQITVPAAANPSSLVAGDLPSRQHGGQYYVDLRLLAVDPAAGADLRSLLRDTAQLLYRWVYTFPSTNLDDAWNKLADSEQLDLAVTQDLCLDSAYHYVRGQLGARSEHLDALFQRWDRERYALTEARVLANDGDSASSAEASLRPVRNELRAMLEGDASIHASLLQAVREKLKGYQYTIDSIPFELLQNADDALEELCLLDPVRVPDTRFVVEFREDGADLIHWGRAINHGGRERGYHRDLEKMLTISASDKGDGATGKFGLGFKSVFLLTERPRVLSRDLAFEVVGGVYPMRVSGAAFTQMRSKLNEHGSADGTLIRLEADPESLEQAFERFTKLAPYMLLFTRRVDRIDIQTPRGLTTLEWTTHPTSIPAAKVRTLPHRERALVIGDERFALALALRSDGFTAFKDDLPDVWITAPTRERNRFAFLLHGMLEPDVGRAQLARSSQENLDRARRFAPILYRALSAAVTIDAVTLQADLSLAREPDTAFWATLFEVLSAGIHRLNQDEDAVRIAWTLLWADRGAARRWIEEHDALPTSLPGAHAPPTRLDRVRFVVKGGLGERDLFNAIAVVPGFARRHPPGTLIAESVATRLYQLHVPLDVHEVRLFDVIRAVIGEDGLVRPDVAAELGSLVATTQLAQLSPEEADELWSYIRDVRFKNRAGGYVPARDMLRGAEASDEARQAAFAPDANRLAASYEGNALAWFEYCRGREGVPFEVLARWVLDAESDVQRLAALKYLLEGVDGASIAHHHLAGRLGGTWLENLDEFHALGVEELSRLQGLLGLGREGPAQSVDEGEAEHQLLSNDPRELFQRVAARWRNEAGDLLEQYESTTYPWPLRLEPEYDPNDLDQRRGWLTLLLIGSMFRLGRVRSEQNRGFLERCEEEGWMRTFIKAGMRDRSIEERNLAWMSVIESYLASVEETNHEEYRYWLDQFVTIYQLSTWLDDYAELLLGLEHAKEDAKVLGVWNPMEDPERSGSGTRMPSLKRALSGGKHFVLRELLRYQVLTNTDVLAPHAYFSSQRLRELFERVLRPLPAEPDAASRAIHRELVQVLGSDGALFGNAFDLPFWFRLHEVP